MIFFNQGMLLLVFTLPYIASWLWVDSNCPIVDLLQLAIFFFLEANCTVLANLFHSLDIWHKSIKLTAKISAVSISGFSNIID